DFVLRARGIEARGVDVRGGGRGGGQVRADAGRGPAAAVAVQPGSGRGAGGPGGGAGRGRGVGVVGRDPAGEQRRHGAAHAFGFGRRRADVSADVRHRRKPADRSLAGGAGGPVVAGRGQGRGVRRGAAAGRAG